MEISPNKSHCVVQTSVFMTGYVLKLEDGCWYCGITSNLNKRLYQHWNGEGAYFTRKHRPLELTETYIVPANYNTWEHTKTLELMCRYGFYKVRGATWVASGAMDKPAILADIEKMAQLRLEAQKKPK